MTDFEDPTSLARCIKSDCSAYRAGGTPFCAEHLREQEKASAGISEPEVEALARAAGDAAMAETYFGSDPDASGLISAMHKMADLEDKAVERDLFSDVKARPDPAELEPHWDGTQWVLREKRQEPDLNAIRSAVRDLMSYLDIHEADDPD
jgi:hypothetical protein